MAKQFAGFTPQQTAVLLQKMGYRGPADPKSMQQFMTANPAAAARMGKYTATAQRMIAGEPAAKSVPPAAAMGMREGGEVRREKGVSREPVSGSVTAASKKVATAVKKPKTATAIGNTGKGILSKYTPAGMATAVKKDKKKKENEKAVKKIEKGQQDIITAAYTDPTKLVTEAKAPEFTKEEEKAGTIAEDTGKLAPAPKVDVTTATTSEATAAKPVEAVSFESLAAAPEAEKIIEESKAVTGEVSPEAQATAQTMDAANLAQLGMNAAQLEAAQTVKEPPPREVQAGELVSGPTVDMARVDKLMSTVQAAEATPSKMATVQGQMEELMQQFEGKQPPAWAAGAMRAATAALASRGLGASSMAGQAVVQAAMESALPIAMADAQTRASFEAQNLSNRQQTALFAAQQRASFLNMEFDQAFQTRVLNASRIADIADMNFNASVQIALENSRNAQSVDLANLSAKNAKILADAAAMTQVDLANLNNRQQAAVQNANAFLQMDMQNLSNQQQTALFNTQARMQALLTDTASENAARQFNAASQNQVNQFNASLVAQISQFNAAQKNAMAQFNAGEANDISVFRAELKNARDIFEAQNATLIAQSNAQWRQNIATTEFAAIQQVNLQNALAATGITKGALDNLWQRERDLMSFAWQSSESAETRAVNLLIAKLGVEAEKELQKSTDKLNFVSSLTSSLAKIWTFG